ncbi:MAG TPA: hypothetical protein VFB34_03905 [Chloroflexota bacterium]|nr:hypothetical protein [Chloroflexota bacterium]
MSYLVAAILIVMFLVLVLFALAVLAAVVCTIAFGLGAAWLLWRVLPLGRQVRQALSRSPVDRLTDHYVAGHIDIREFEQRLAHVLSHRVPQP